MNGLWRWPGPWLRAGFWLLVLAVVTLSLTPVEHLPPQVFDIWDKAQHAFAFAVLAWMGLWAYPLRRWQLLAGLLLLGGAIELAQAATGWRYGEWADLFADVVGVIVGAVAWTAISARLTLKTG